MKKLLLGIFLSLFLITPSFAQEGGTGLFKKLEIATLDGTVVTFPYEIKVSNGTLTNNGDGTVTLTTGGGSGTPGGSNTQVQFNDSSAFGGNANFTFTKATSQLQLNGPFYVGSGTNPDATTALSYANNASKGIYAAIYDASSNSACAYWSADRFRGTRAIPAAVQSGDWLLWFSGTGGDSNAASASGADFVLAADAAPGVGYIPGRISFFTTLDATHTQQERMRIDKSGNVTIYAGQLISNIATGTAPFSVASTTPVANLSIGGNAATVTTNANLTGVITSVGNATSIASQTGTGTKFVVDTSPTLVTPTLGAATATSINIAVASIAGTYTGNTITLTSTETQGIGDAVKIDSNGKAHLAKADVIADASAVALAATAVTGSASNTYLLPGGTLKLSSSPSWTVGGLIYLSTTGTTGNTLTQTAPSATNNVIQILGVALAADTILFSPSLVQVEHS